MVLMDHVKLDLSCLRERDCILAPNTNKFFQCTTYPNRQGAYLYFDSNLSAFV